MSTEALRVATVLGSVSHRAGGLFNSVRRLSISLWQAEVDIDVMAPADRAADADRAAWTPLEPFVPRRRGPERLAFAPMLGRRLRDGGFNVVHQHGIWQAFSAQVLGWRRRTGGPVMISPRGMLDPWALRNSGWKKVIAARAFENLNLLGAACIHALNASEAASIRAYGLGNPIATIPNGTDLPSERPERPARPSFLPNDGCDTLLFIGRLHPKKGIANLIEAFAAARMADPVFAERWRLVIAGWDDGGHEATLRDAVVRHGLKGKVVFPGPLLGAEKDATLRHADAFILPSFSEGLPMAVLEAWAYRLPVLMTDACNLPEGFSSGAAIRIVNDPGTLAGQLVSHLAGDLSSMGAAGRALAESRFSWPTIAARHIAVYRFLRDGGNAPPDVSQ
jgi:glycosyltransferase involved in cell wall biosynthesis